MMVNIVAKTEKEFPHLFVGFSLQFGVGNSGLLAQQATALTAWQRELPNYHLAAATPFNFNDVVLSLGLCLDRHWEVELETVYTLDRSFFTILSKEVQEKSPALVYEQQYVQLAALVRWLFFKDIDKSLNLRFSPFLQLGFGLQLRLKERFGYAELGAKKQETWLQNSAQYDYSYKEFFFRKHCAAVLFLEVGCGIVFEFAGLRFLGGYGQRLFFEKLYTLPAFAILSTETGEKALFSFSEIFNYGYFQVGLVYLFNPRVSKNAEQLFRKKNKPFEQRIG